MRRLLLLLGAAAIGCSAGDELVYPQLPDPDPFHPTFEARIETDAALDVVGVGTTVRLRWTPFDFAQFFWTLEPPLGSTAALADATTREPSFTADVEGVYRVAVSARDAPAPAERASKRITAAAYLGAAACAQCHGERAAGSAATGHARALADFAPELFAQPACLRCHVVGSDATRLEPVPGGFDAEAARLGFDPTAYAWSGMDAFRADFPALADRGSVQCESCHGPGGLHQGDPRLTTVSTDAAVCGACHDTFGPTYAQWRLSPHAKPPPEAAVADPDCARCHTARAFARRAAGLAHRPETREAPGVACAACHDPHSAAFPSEVRLFGNVPLGDGAPLDSGRAAACAACHQSEVGDAQDRADAGLAFPCAVQADMLAGRGGVEYGRSFGSSFHGNPGMKLRNFTGDPSDPLVAEACVTCHMAPAPRQGSLRDRLGAHTLHLREGSTELAVGNCDRCHAGLSTFDRPMGRDYDGNGAAEGVQTEVRGLLERLHAVLEASDARDGVDRPGGAGTPVVVSGDLSRTTPELRRAAYNYNFVATDGSFGVHNTVYAVQLLQRSYEHLTGRSFASDFPGAYLP